VSVGADAPVVARAGRDQVPAGLQAELALLRTRLAVERTLLAVVRSALGLITFGIVLFEFVDFLRGRPQESAWIPHDAARNIGIGLTAMAIAMLVAGIVSTLHVSRRLHARWDRLRDLGQIPTGDRMPTSFIPAVAFMLLLVGIFVIIRMIWKAGYFA
jgi:putative membrane protein